MVTRKGKNFSEEPQEPGRGLINGNISWVETQGNAGLERNDTVCPSVPGGAVWLGWVGTSIIGTGWEELKRGETPHSLQVRSYCISFSRQFINYEAVIIPLKKSFWLSSGLPKGCDSAEISGVDFDLLSLNERIMPRGPESLSCCTLLKLTVSRYTS